MASEYASRLKCNWKYIFRIKIYKFTPELSRQSFFPSSFSISLDFTPSFTFHDSIFYTFIWLAFDIINFILLPFFISLSFFFFIRELLNSSSFSYCFDLVLALQCFHLDLFWFHYTYKVFFSYICALLSSCKVLAFCWSFGWVPGKRIKIINFILNFNFMTLLFKSIFYQYFIASFYYNFSFGC